MTVYPTDNSDNGDILRTVLWQYDNAEKLAGIILAWKEMFDGTTKAFFDELVESSDPLTAGDQLATWGKTLGIMRPTLDIDGVKTSLSTELYRRLIIGRVRLLNSNASFDAYVSYLKYVFNGRATVYDNQNSTFPNMGLTFTFFDGNPGSDADEVAEMSALISQYPELAFIFPSGVEDTHHSESAMFGLAESYIETGTDTETEIYSETEGQQFGETGTDPIIGGLDDSSFNWRITPEGNWRA